MVKVEHTRKYRLSTPISRNPIDYESLDVLVADVELVFVKCEWQESIFAISTHGAIKPPPIYLSNKEKRSMCTYYKPILISRTEKIDDNYDWYYNSNTKSIHNTSNVSVKMWGSDKLYKILALPEHFSTEQLQMLVDSKLKEGKCLVECEVIKNYYDKNKGVCGITMCYFNDEKVKDKCLGWCHNQPVIKLNPHITIYPVEEKMYTRAQVKEIVLRAWGRPDRHPDFDKWFEDNIN